MSSLKATDTNKDDKKTCPFGLKCYRRNPIHFREMAHPHLEKLITAQDGIVKIPDTLDFPCDNKELLMDQLRILQGIFGKTTNNAAGIQNNSNINNDATPSTVPITDITKKRKCTDEEDTCTSKKFGTATGSKPIEKERNVEKIGSESQNSKLSVIENYSASKTAETRKIIREKTIMSMRRSGYKVSLVDPGKFKEKYEQSHPYNIFYTRVENNPETYQQPYSITFPEILDISLGEIASSLHVNFMVDVGWVCLQYLLAGQRINMTILYGERADTEPLPSTIQMVPVLKAHKFSIHHSKLMILKYKDDSIRVVVSTANLYSDDWENRTQGLWISPNLPQLDDSASSTEGESPTGFKKDLIRYLILYRDPNLSEWLAMIRRADFTTVKVFLLASFPGHHTLADSNLWGHRRLAAILGQHSTLPPDAPQWTIIAQSSSIGSLGPSYDSWLLKDLVSSMSRETEQRLKSQPNFRFIYPSVSNFKESYDCRDARCCLPYRLAMHSRQEWFESYLYQWKARGSGRNKAMPHIKSYTRVSPDHKRISWFVLTSANLSKAAWGQMKASNSIQNHEVGVVFLPKFITGKTTFPIKPDSSGDPVFPIIYDLPLTRYESTDRPFVSDFFDE